MKDSSVKWVCVWASVAVSLQGDDTLKTVFILMCRNPGDSLKLWFKTHTHWFIAFIAFDEAFPVEKKRRRTFLLQQPDEEITFCRERAFASRPFGPNWDMMRKQHEKFFMHYIIAESFNKWTPCIFPISISNRTLTLPSLDKILHTSTLLNKCTLF